MDAFVFDTLNAWYQEDMGANSVRIVPNKSCCKRPCVRLGRPCFALQCLQFIDTFAQGLFSAWLKKALKLPVRPMIFRMAAC